MWMDLAIVALLIVGVYAFLQLAGWQTRMATRRTKRTAEDMYDQYADSPHKQRRDAKKHAGA
jgi:type II secretory pathway component PulL